MLKRPDPIDVHVGARIREARVLVGMSQEAVGEKLGITFQQQQKYESGANRVSASRLFRTAEILEMKVQDFFEGLPGYGEDFGEGQDQRGRRATLELVRNFACLPRESRLALATFVKDLAKLQKAQHAEAAE